MTARADIVAPVPAPAPRARSLPHGLWTLEWLVRLADPQSGWTRKCVNGRWVPARPVPFYSWRRRLKLAWMVFRYRADAFVWYDE